MAKDYLEIKTFDGLSTLMSKDNLPIRVAQEIVNLRPGHILGRAVKRKPYTNVLTSGLTSLKSLHEFKNKNDERLLVIMDGNTMERSVYSGGYGAIGSISNDERTAGSTIDGDNFLPTIANNELRSGAGISSATERPLWYGYTAAKNRYNSASTISAGRYLEDQYNASVLDDLFTNTGTIFGEGIFEAVPHTSRATTDSFGLTESHYSLYASPVYDGYQRGFPVFVTSMRIGDDGAGNEGTMEMYLYIKQSDAQESKRLTAVDLFIANAEADIRGQFETVPAYFLERIDLNDDTPHFYETTGTTDNGTSKVTINDFADWLTFDAIGLWLYNVDDDEYYRVTAETVNGANMEFTVTPAPTNSASKTVRFLSRWYADTVSATNYYVIRTFYDNHYKKLGSEMYDYLGIPTGDEGISDFRYQYSAWNGSRLLTGCYPEDKNFTYYSVADSPDIIPSLNIFRHRSNVKGIIDIGDDFLVFTETGVERLSILGNAQSLQNDAYLDAILTNAESIVKISDDEVAFMAYDGPYLVKGRQTVPIGEHLNTWFKGVSAKLTQSQLEGCIAGFNDENNEVWFSFPDYTTSPFTTGLIMVFDLKGFRKDMVSPWWFVKTDAAIKSFTTSVDRKLLGGAATKIVDFDTVGSETVDTAIKFKLMQNVVPNRQVRWGRVFVRSSTSDTITCNAYFDGSASAVAISLNADLNGFIRYMKETLELELTTSATVNTVEHQGLMLEFGTKRVA